ncbi:MAG: hypothetical protein OEY51_05270, partial [Cyclobacteriaceae bacterium]|nr:hypothetical protein [Cyclobacteriaceae bacterium]
MKKRNPQSLLLTIILACAMLPVHLHAQTNDGYVFDEFKVGDNFSEVVQRAPYNQPCDSDPIDNRRFIVYGALPCRDRSFPDETTVMFYLKNSEKDSYNQPIEAFGFLHGS